MKKFYPYYSGQRIIDAWYRPGRVYLQWTGCLRAYAYYDLSKKQFMNIENPVGCGYEPPEWEYCPVPGFEWEDLMETINEVAQKGVSITLTHP